MTEIKSFDRPTRSYILKLENKNKESKHTWTLFKNKRHPVRN